MVDVLIPRELDPGEQRVAATPETVKRLLARGLSLHVEEGAGWAAGFADSDYRSAGATLVGDGAEPRGSPPRGVELDGVELPVAHRQRVAREAARARDRERGGGVEPAGQQRIKRRLRSVGVARGQQGAIAQTHIIRNMGDGLLQDLHMDVSDPSRLDDLYHAALSSLPAKWG